MKKMYETYNKVKRFYEKPRLEWYLGKFVNDPTCMIRRKPQIKLFGKWITLPHWLKFDCISHDIIYKYKWDEVRFEYPPKWTLVIFGISLSFWLKPPTNDCETMENAYWESLIKWANNEERWESRFKDHLVDSAYWSQSVNNHNIAVMSIREEWVKPEFKTAWKIAYEILKETSNKKGYLMV